MSAGASGARWWARLAAGPALVLALVVLVDADDLLERLRDLRWSWVAAALGLSVAQVLLSAWRWRLTALRLGLELPFRAAVREYYLAIFLNQILPGGVLGDASRAWRHARGAPRGPALRAVILERASGQVVMALVAAVSLVWAGPRVWRAAGAGAGTDTTVALVLTGLIGLFAVTVALGRIGARARVPPSPLGRLRADARRALLHRDVAAKQFGSSALIVASYVATFLLAARAVSVTTPLSELAPLVAPVLVSMLLPVTVAGWGVREGAAAAIWGLTGLAPADGVAISVAYGTIVLAGTLPGALVAAGLAYGTRSRSGGEPLRSRSKSMSSPIVK